MAMGGDTVIKLVLIEDLEAVGSDRGMLNGPLVPTSSF